MIRKSILSVLSGVVFALLLSFTVRANAGCMGLCANWIGDYAYAGCVVGVEIDLVTNTTTIVDVTCFYTHVARIEDPNIAD